MQIGALTTGSVSTAVWTQAVRTLSESPDGALNFEKLQTGAVTNNVQSSFGTYYQISGSALHTVKGAVINIVTPAFAEFYSLALALGGAGVEVNKIVLDFAGAAAAMSYSIYVPIDPSVFAKGGRITVAVANNSNANQRTFGGVAVSLLERND